MASGPPCKAAGVAAPVGVSQGAAAAAPAAAAAAAAATEATTLGSAAATGRLPSQQQKQSLCRRGQQRQQQQQQQQKHSLSAEALRRFFACSAVVGGPPNTASLEGQKDRARDQVPPFPKSFAATRLGRRGNLSALTQRPAHATGAAAAAGAAAPESASRARVAAGKAATGSAPAARAAAAGAAAAAEPAATESKRAAGAAARAAARAEAAAASSKEASGSAAQDAESRATAAPCVAVRTAQAALVSTNGPVPAAAASSTVAACERVKRSCGSTRASLEAAAAEPPYKLNRKGMGTASPQASAAATAAAGSESTRRRVAAQQQQREGTPTAAIRTQCKVDTASQEASIVSAQAEAAAAAAQSCSSSSSTSTRRTASVTASVGGSAGEGGAERPAVRPWVHLPEPLLLQNVSILAREKTGFLELERLARARSSALPQRLQVLVMRRCSRITDKGLRTLLLRLRELRCLDLRDSFSLTDEALGILGLLPRLERLALGLTAGARGCCRLTCRSLKALFTPQQQQQQLQQHQQGQQQQPPQEQEKEKQQEGEKVASIRFLSLARCSEMKDFGVLSGAARTLVCMLLLLLH
ncbi:hypothetical protein ACSSS7_006616 [Eimeria intestinalis]